MKIEQNTISRDWIVVHRGRRFSVNFTESDGQTLALCNRENWRIREETEDGMEELSAGVLKDSSPEEQRRAGQRARTIDGLIAFCVRHWDNRFLWRVRREMKERWKKPER